MAKTQQDIVIPETFRGRPYAERHFRQVVERARETNPFYRRWLAESGEVPIIDRATILDHNEEILNGNRVTTTTSGSTGVPVKISMSKERSQMSHEAEQQFVKMLGGYRKRVRIVHPPNGSRDPNLMDVSKPLDQQIEFILERREKEGITAITTYPTNAEFLCREIEERGLDFSFIDRFGVFSEVFEPYQRKLVEETFPGAQIWSTYSSMEFGMIAFPCPYEKGYHHVAANLLGLEVLDEDGLPCEPGQRGRVVITDYFNFNSPMIRYEIGDYVERAECPCGKITFPALGRIFGKVRGFLVHRDGRRVMFTDLSVSLVGIEGMRQYQVIQHALEDFTVKVVARRRMDAEVREAFVEGLGYLPDQVRVEYVEEIPRGKNGKFYASICEIS